MNEFNKNVIEEFRANGGVCGGPFEGAPMILVHHKGAKTGTERVSPLVYQADGGTRLRGEDDPVVPVG
ncbi:MAG: nitroreductase/quinone reductase family protein, partial [Actinomycetota bacterium]